MNITIRNFLNKGKIFKNLSYTELPNISPIKEKCGNFTKNGSLYSKNR